MKKVIIILGLLLMSLTTAMGQIRFWDGTLDEALEKAGAENKKVWIVCSTTWCGPCKRMDAEIYTLPDVGEFFNRRFICMKYDLDVNDPNDINERFAINIYPTFLILDPNGEEFTRLVGAYYDPQEFLEKTRDGLENPIKLLAEGYEADPRKYALNYLTALFKALRNSQAMDVHLKTFGMRTEEENFSEYLMSRYPFTVNSLYHIVAQYMLDHRDAVIAVTGREQYDRFIGDLHSKPVLSALSQMDSDKIKAAVYEYSRYKSRYVMPANELADFVEENVSIIANKDLLGSIEAAKAAVEAGRLEERINKLNLGMALNRMARSMDYGQMRPEIEKLVDFLNDYSKNVLKKEGDTYDLILGRLQPN
ncbi:MAG: thioredoxin family protein [Rikenellaceae bacterium]|nr:thioredoxin family protein [Rikenellaceae bacterium]MCL2693378.1 thioredoxin family protein [Rikenellaceae bacterium]